MVHDDEDKFSRELKLSLKYLGRYCITARDNRYSCDKIHGSQLDVHTVSDHVYDHDDHDGKNKGTILVKIAYCLICMIEKKR